MEGPLAGSPVPGSSAGDMTALPDDAAPGTGFTMPDTENYNAENENSGKNPASFEDADDDSDINAGADSDAGFNPDNDAGLEPDSDTESDYGSDREFDAETDYESDHESDAETDYDTESGYESDADTDADAEPGHESDTETDADIESDAGTDAGTDADTESGHESDAASDAETVSSMEDSPYASYDPGESAPLMLIEAIERQNDILCAGFSATVFILGIILGVLAMHGFRLRRV